MYGRYSPTSDQFKTFSNEHPVHAYQGPVTPNTTYCNVSGQFYRLDFKGGKGGPKPLFSEIPIIPLCTLNFLYVYDTVLQLHVSTKLRIYVDLAHAQERKVTLREHSSITSSGFQQFFRRLIARTPVCVVKLYENRAF